MPCAGEGDTFPVRDFTKIEANDYSCDDCGWMQMSFAAGLKELCWSATFHNLEGWIYIRNKAIMEGVRSDELPEFPPYHIELED